jgi:hypothetical protein
MGESQIPICRVLAEAYRKIDYKRNKDGVPATGRDEHDPTCRRSLRYSIIGWREALHHRAAGIKVGQVVISGERVEPDLGNAIAEESMPLSTQTTARTAAWRGWGWRAGGEARYWRKKATKPRLCCRLANAVCAGRMPCDGGSTGT